MALLGIQAMNEGLPESTQVWNRACGFGKFGELPREGDRALEALLYIHGLVMNGGLGHAYDIAEKRELEEGINGYRFFGLSAHAELLVQGWSLDEIQQEELSPEYSVLGEDEALTEAFERKFKANPDLFAPLLTS